VICQECGVRPATLHFTKIVNGEKSELHICELCAREKGELIPGAGNGFSIHNLLSGLLDFEPTDTGVKPSTLRCGTCGMTYAQFGKIGRFGCSDCYRNFASRLDPLLKRVQGGKVHVGKVPRRAGGKMRTKREIERLRRELQLSVEREDFETAAHLRDRIRELEREIG
jgi:protein arginine kinase activator